MNGFLDVLYNKNTCGSSMSECFIIWLSVCTRRVRFFFFTEGGALYKLFDLDSVILLPEKSGWLWEMFSQEIQMAFTMM